LVSGEGLTWEDVVVEGPGDLGQGGAAGPAAQRQALPLVESHVPRQAVEGRVGVDGQDRRVAVLPHGVGGHAGVDARVIRLEEKEKEEGNMQDAEFR